MRRRLIFLTGLVPVLFGAALAVYRPPFFARIDAATYDAVLRSGALRTPAGYVAIVDIDDRSLASFGQWPWRRDLIGRLITSLRAAGARSIALDVIFPEPDRRGADGPSGDAADGPTDRALAQVLRDSGAVLGYGITFDPGARSSPGCAEHPLPVTIVR